MAQFANPLKKYGGIGTKNPKLNGILNTIKLNHFILLKGILMLMHPNLYTVCYFAP